MKLQIIITLLTALLINGCGAGRELNNRLERELDAATKNLLVKVNAKLAPMKAATLLYAQACRLAKLTSPETIKVRCSNGRQGEEPYPQMPPTYVITKCDTDLMVRDQIASVLYVQDGQTYMSDLEPNTPYQTTTNCIISVDNTGN